MEGEGPYQSLEFENRTSVIRNPDGSVVSEWENVTVPKHWSQVAADIMAQKYFRKAGIPRQLKPAKEKGSLPGYNTLCRIKLSQIKKKMRLSLLKRNLLHQKQTHGKFFIGWQVAGHIGAINITISIQKGMRVHSMMSFVTCLPIKWLLQIHLNGSIPG